MLGADLELAGEHRDRPPGPPRTDLCAGAGVGGAVSAAGERRGKAGPQLAELQVVGAESWPHWENASGLRRMANRASLVAEAIEQGRQPPSRSGET